MSLIDLFNRVVGHTEYEGGQEVVTDHDGIKISTTVTNDGIIEVQRSDGKNLYTGRDAQQAKANIESAVRVHELYKER